MTALRGLSVKLGSLREGRKAIIFVSEGFSSLLPPQMRDPNAQMPGMCNPAARNPSAGGGAAEERARFRSDTQLYSDLRVVFDTANRHNTAIYAIDPRGLATGEFDINENVGGTIDQDYLQATQDTLRVLAINTDGRAIINRNDLEKGLRQVVRDTSAYYLVGYNSPVAGRRQVPRDQGPPEAAGPAGAIAQGLLGADRGGGGQGDGAAEAAYRRRRSRRRSAASRRASGTRTSRRGLAPGAAATAARASPSCGSRSRRFPARSARMRRASRCWRPAAAARSTSAGWCRPRTPRPLPTRPRRWRRPRCARDRR